MKKLKFQSPTGMHDILWGELEYFQRIYETVEEIANFYEFKRIETPILEKTDLFLRSTGLTTDIVQKQMFTLRTKGEDSLTLRPEFTPGVARAYIEHGMFNLPQPINLWYFGPLFRYEKPQAGRFRQFHQCGFETFGESDSIIDAFIIQMCFNVLKKVSSENLIIKINSIGDNQCRPYYKKVLTSYLKRREEMLCSDCRRRLRENPLRILDCKEEKCQPIKSHAPQILNHLCEECHNHFKEVLEFLDEISLPYYLDPYLVRGLDYYTKTVFEIEENSEEGEKMGSLAGGGRYDNLVKVLGGKETPACGGAMGIERIITIMKRKSIKFSPETPTKVFLAQLGNLAKKKSLKILEDFRKEKISISQNIGKNSLNAQLNRANKMGIKYSLILGQKESLEGTIIIKDMETGKQEIVKQEKLIEEIKKKLKK